MRSILVIGIGAGDPEYLTMQAIKALNRVDVFFVADKGAAKSELVELRREICERYIDGRDYRFVQLPDPARDRSAAAYENAVADWHSERAAQYEATIQETLGPDGVGAFLVWGDPMLYDGTLRTIEKILARGVVEFSYEVIPGITSIQALAAGHRIPLNRIGESVQLTTGRRLSQGLPPSSSGGGDDFLIMLDAGFAANHSDELGPDVDVYWGAYLGTPDEILIAGKLGDVGSDIERVKAESRERKGWIMDTYLLRRPPADPRMSASTTTESQAGTGSGLTG